MPVHRTKKRSKPSRHRSKGHHHRSKGYHHRSKSISQKTYKNLKMSTPSTINQDKLHQLVNMIKLQRKGLTKSKTNLAARLNDLRKTPMHPQQHMQMPLSMPMYPQQQMPYPQQHIQMPMPIHHQQHHQPIQLMMIKSNSNMKGTSPRRHKIIKMKFPVPMTMPIPMSMKTGNPKVKKYSKFVQSSYAAINKNGQKEEYGQKVETDSTTPFFEVTKVHNDHVDHFHIPK